MTNRLPAIFRNTRLSASAIWQAVGLSLLASFYVKYLAAPVWTWLTAAFHDFTSVNVFAALSGNQSQIMRSLPMILAWGAISLICYVLYLIMSNIWNGIKVLVPIQVSVLTKKNDIFDNLIFLNYLVRIMILLAFAGLTPLAIFVVAPVSISLSSALLVSVSDPIYNQFYTIILMFFIWLVYFLVLYYVAALINYEREEAELDEEHNPVIYEEEARESEEE